MHREYEKLSDLSRHMFLLFKYSLSAKPAAFRDRSIAARTLLSRGFGDAVTVKVLPSEVWVLNQAVDVPLPTPLWCVPFFAPSWLFGLKPGCST